MILEEQSALEIFINLKMTWQHAIIAVPLRECFTKFSSLNLIKETKSWWSKRIISGSYDYYKK